MIDVGFPPNLQVTLMIATNKVHQVPPNLGVRGLVLRSKVFSISYNDMIDVGFPPNLQVTTGNYSLANKVKPIAIGIIREQAYKPD